MSRVQTDATAFAHRTAEAMLVGAAFLPEDSTAEQLIQAIRHFDAVKQFGLGGYAGFLGTATDDDVAAIYPAQTLNRLQAVKRKYDPANVFRQNFNIRP